MDNKMPKYTIINTENSRIKKGEILYFFENGKSRCIVVEEGVDYEIDECYAHLYDKIEKEDIVYGIGYSPCCPPVECDSDPDIDPDPLPCIKITKSVLVDRVYTIGETVRYLFMVENCGNVDLQNVIVSDSIASVAGSPVTLAVGESYDGFYADYIIQEQDADLAQGVLSNTASAMGFDSDGIMISDSDTLILTVEEDFVATPSIQISKSASPNSNVRVGDTITYTISILNNGNVSLFNVGINDSMFSSSTVIAELEPSEIDNTTFVFEHIVTEDDFNNQTIANSANAFGDYSGTQVTSNDSEVVTNILPEINVDLSIEKSASPLGPYVEGDVISMTYTVFNNSNVDVENIVVTDTLATVSGGPITLSVGAQDSTSFTGFYTVTADDVIAGTLSCESTVSGNSIEDPSITGSDTSSITLEVIESPVRCVNFTKSCDDSQSYSEGDIIRFIYDIENCGNQSIDNIVVTDDKVAVMGSLSSLSAGASDSTTFFADYEVTAQDVINGSVTNTATVTYDFDGSQYSESDSHTASTIEGEMPSIIVVKSANTDKVYVGDEIEYSYIIQNNGNTDVVINSIDDDKTTVSGSSITIASGQSSTVGDFTSTYIVTSDDLDEGFVSNTATVNATGPSGQSVIATTTLSVVVCEIPASCISISKTCDLSKNYREQDEIVYTLSITNCGQNDLENIVLSDSLVPVSGSLSMLPAGATDNTSFTATYTVDSDDVVNGSVVNTATVQANGVIGGELVSATSTHTAITEITPNPCISIEKSCENKLYDVQDVINYTIEISNCGNVDFQGITVADSLYPVLGGPINLASGQSDSTSFTVSHVVTQDDLEAQSITNTATVSVMFEGASYTASDTHVVSMVDLVACVEVIKTASTEGPVNVDDVITYFYEVRNCGNVRLQNVLVTDDKTFVLGNAITLDVGETNTNHFTSTYTVTADDLANEEITNTATVSAQSTTGTSLSDTDMLTIPVEPVANPCIDITKTCSPAGPYEADQVITYNYEISNCGNVDFTDVIVTDDKVVVNGSAISLSAGQSDSTTFSSTYTVTQADVDNESITNIGTVTATYDGSQITATDTHVAVTVETCISDPITATCNVAAEEFDFIGNPDISDISISPISGGGFGTTCHYNDGAGTEADNSNSLGIIRLNNNTANIPVPAHTDGCLLFLHVTGGDVISTGAPLLLGSTGNALTPFELSNLIDSSSGIFNQVVMIEGDGIEAGTIDIQLPDLDPAFSRDLIKYYWSQVCSSTCKMRTDMINTSSVIESNQTDAFTTNCPALAFASAKSVGGYVDDTSENVIEECDDCDCVSSECLDIDCIEQNCLNECDDPNSMPCIDNDWIAGGNTTYSTVTAESQFDNAGIGMEYYPIAGLNSIDFNSNPDSNFGVIYSVFQFDLCSSSSNNEFFTSPCVMTYDNTTGRCNYPINYTCSSMFSVTFTPEENDNDSVVVITPEFNGVLDPSQAVTLNSSGATTINVSTSGTAGDGDQISCQTRFKVEFSGCSGKLSFGQILGNLSGQ